MSRNVLMWGLCLFMSIGCENADVRKSSELESFRILGLKVTPHVIALDSDLERLSVEIIGFEKSKVRAFEWTLCASLGAADRFECLPDTPTLTGQSDADQWSIPFSAALFSGGVEVPNTEFESEWSPPICPDYELLSCIEQSECPEGALCLAEGCRSPTEVFPIQLILRVVPFIDDEQPLPAAVTIPIRATASTNTAIQIDDLSLDGKVVTSPRDEAGCFALTMDRPQEGLTLAVDVNEESVDVFQSEEDGMCIQRTERETGIVSWFAKGASIETSVTDLETPTTKLEIEPNGEMPVIVYSVLRDGRGSLDARCLAITFD